MNFVTRTGHFDNGPSFWFISSVPIAVTNPGLPVPLSKAHKEQTEARVRTLTAKVDEFTLDLDEVIESLSRCSTHKRQSKKAKAA